MASEAKKRKMSQKKEAEPSDEDVKLREELLQLVEDVIENKSLDTTVSNLRRHIRTSTTSLTALPKPLKYLKDSYEPLKAAYKKLADSPEKKRLADVISVLALASAPDNSRECLDYCLRGTRGSPGRWGHEYVSRLEAEIVEEWTTAPFDREDEIMNDLLPIIKKIIVFDAKHNAEIQACDLCLEINKLDLLQDCLDKNNYSKICLYLVSIAAYSEDLERRSMLRTATSHYLKFNDHSKAILVAMQIPDHDLVHECFVTCQDPLLRKQLAYTLARLKDQPLKKAYKGEDASAIEEILSNGHVSDFYLKLARELDIMEPRSPDEIYESWLDMGLGLVLERSSARANLAATYASSFVHVGFGVDKLMSNTEQCWVYKNQDHGMMAATASLGLIHLWDVDGGLGAIYKFLYVNDDLVRSGALLAIGLVNCGVRNECDSAMALLSEYTMSPGQNLRIGSVLGLGLAYAASRRTDVNNLIGNVLNDKDSNMEVISMAAIALALVNVGSRDADVSSTILQKLLELDAQQLSSTYSRFLPLALGIVYMGSRDSIEAATAALDVLPDPYKLPAQTMLQVCSYAGTDDVLVVQELLHILSEPVEDDNDLAKSSSSNVNKQTVFGCCSPPNTQNSDSKQSNATQTPKVDKPQSEMALTQPIASLGVAVVGLSDGQENNRIFGQIGRYGMGPARLSVPLAFALSYISTADPAVIDVLNKYSHDNDSSMALNAIFGLGLIGAGTNSSRVVAMLRQLAAYYSRSPSHLFLISIAQGLVRLGKGTITLQPLKFSLKILDQAALAGLLIVLVSFLDCKNLILGKSHYLMYCLALAMEPRWLVTLDENLELLPVSVRVGKSVDVIGKAGEPKSITRGNVSTTPVLMSHGEKAELVNADEYETLADPMESFIILRAKQST